MLVVDRMLPGLDGLSLVRALRGARVTTPVIFLTTPGGVDDRIEGLNATGDDYLIKPFAFGELSARIHALARRPQIQTEETVLSAGDLSVDLIRRKGRVQTRTMLLEAVWDIGFDPQTNVVETHISRLRAKVDKPFGRDLIRTVRGAGYRIDG